MEKQHCKVGAQNPIPGGNKAIRSLQLQQQFFIRKAQEASGANRQLMDFFEAKARKIERMLAEIA
ncbi:hypothetical protein [Robiginitalea sp. IMCC43444]|uniref:hypothetical protein n=1 Tax=Robiginitalea sp. IMCC43444 TaxID=3459121 RepID=UPI0040430575